MPYYSFNGQFDFFNYAGIHRSVMLYTTPKTYVKDITVVTHLEDDGSVTVDYTVMVAGGSTGSSIAYEVSLSETENSLLKSKVSG